MRALEEIVAVGPKATKEPRKAGPDHVGAQAGRTSPSGSRSATTPGSRSTSAGPRASITVEFATLEDLERIVEMMDPKRQ